MRGEGVVGDIINAVAFVEDLRRSYDSLGFTGFIWFLLKRLLVLISRVTQRRQIISPDACMLCNELLLIP
jgi:hypothetical protein